MDNGESSYRRYLDGDDEGFVEIVRDYKDGLIRYIDSIVNNASLSEELAEDAFVKLGIKKPAFRGRSSFRTWLYAVGRNTALDHLRKRSGSETVPIDECEDVPDGPTPEDELLKNEDAGKIRRSVRSLKSEYRQIIQLLYYEGFTVREAAGIMKKSVHGTETLAYRARQALKSKLEQEGYGK